MTQIFSQKIAYAAKLSTCGCTDADIDAPRIENTNFVGSNLVILFIKVSELVITTMFQILAECL